MIKLENITKSYMIGDTHYHALKNISFSIAAGELIAIVGPSGSGKTSIMNIVGLLDTATSGHYYLNRDDTSQLTSDQRADIRNGRIGFIFQLYFLLPKLTALENVLLPLTYRRHEPTLSAKAMREKALYMLHEVDMDRYAHHRPMQLSGGQQQRVAIARALVNEPDIIMADEPTGALDTVTSQQIMDLLIQQVSKRNTTVVVVTHSPVVAAQCHRAIHIQDGVVQ